MALKPFDSSLLILYKSFINISSAKSEDVAFFEGYLLIAVGEKSSEMYKVLDYTTPALPKDKPRYLMGVGYPDNIIESVKRGVDMFDCVIPTREARHGRLYLWKNKSRPML